MAFSNLAERGAVFVDRLYALAGNREIIDLAREYPAFDSPSTLVDLAVKYTRTHSNQYAPHEGILPLRQAVASRLEKLYSCQYNPVTEITVTAGGTQGIHTAISAMVAEGDEVIVFEPAHEIYVPAILSNGGSPVYITLKKPEFRIDWEEVQKMINSRTRLILINSPHNPTGTILTAFDMEKLQKIVTGTRIQVISDEVFEYLIYEGFEHQSVARYPALAEKSLLISSFGKSFHISGWKIGYCAGPSSLTEKFRRMQQFQIHSAATPIQYALADYLNEFFTPPEIASFYQGKRDLFTRLLKNGPLKLYQAAGSFFMLIDTEGISPLKDTELAEMLISEHGLLALPVSVFQHDHLNQFLLRLCFARPDSDLEQAARRLTDAFR